MQHIAAKMELPYPFFVYNLLLILVLIGLFVVTPRHGFPISRRFRAGFGRLARRRGLSLSAVGGTAFLLCAALGLWHLPQPNVHDEFSYLLLADTFAHGRLSNPTPPLWRHFETMHVLFEPTYASKYPPGQGLVLAFGQIMTGIPIVGVWLLTGLACAAVCWMLYAWLPSRWALLGGFLLALHPTVLRWGCAYWGGCLAMLGGALTAGAMGRLLREPVPRPRMGAVFGLGLVVLALSRPYEGMVFGLLCLLVTAHHFLSRSAPARGIFGFRFSIFGGQVGSERRRAQGRVVLSMLLVLVVGFLWMGYYNYRVTGNPLRLPYTVYQAANGMAPSFVFLPVNTAPVYHNREMRVFHSEWELLAYQKQRSLKGFLITASKKLYRVYWAAFPLVVYLVPFAALPWAFRRSRSTRLALGILVVFCLATLPETWMQGHYVAPAVGLLLLVGLQSLRRFVRLHRHGRPLGLVLAEAMLAAAVLSVPVVFMIHAEDSRLPFPAARAHMLAQLQQDPNRHLVIVRYGPNHPVFCEWVYNEADIPHAKVVWARDMSPEENRELITAYPGRRVWRLDADAEPPRLTPYPSAQAASQ